MRIFRFMSKEEFENYLQGELIEGKFAKGKACFLEESIPSREKEDSVRQLTDITSLNFKSTDFEGQMNELSELISPTFKTGDFEGQLKLIEYLTLADFMSKIREGVTADVLVEFETTDEFERESEKVIMSYKKHLIEEIQSKGYSMQTLKCVSYKIDLDNKFKNGIGVNTIPRNMFKGVEETLKQLENEEQSKNKNFDTRILNDDLNELSSETTISNFNEMSQNLKETQKQIEQKQINDTGSKKEKGWDINDN